MSAKSSLESIPNENKSVIGSIVTDAKISSKLPDNMKSLAFVLNEGSDISKSQISPFVTYMYADGTADEPNSQRGRIAKNYTKKHKEVMKEVVTRINAGSKDGGFITVADDVNSIYLHPDITGIESITTV